MESVGVSLGISQLRGKNSTVSEILVAVVEGM